MAEGSAPRGLPRLAYSEEMAGIVIRRLPRWAWLFVVLALVVLLEQVVSYADSVNPATLWWWSSVMVSLILVTETLLPVAVLLWRPDAWHSARLVLVGALVWTSLSVLLTAIVWLLSRGLGLVAPDSGLDPATDSLQNAISLIAPVGPLIVLVGLERIRVSRTTWPIMPIGLILAAIAALATWSAWNRFEGEMTFLWDPIGGPGLRDWIRTISYSLEAYGVLPVVALAWAAFSGRRAGEEPRRMWSLLTAGTLLLLGPWTVTLLLTVIWQFGPEMTAIWEVLYLATTVAALAGHVAILAAFLVPFWNEVRGATPAGRYDGVPDAGGSRMIAAWGDPRIVRHVPSEMNGVRALAAGTDHALALDGQGQIVAWGANRSGQLDVPLGIAARAVAAGDGFSVALLEDGGVVAWGDASERQCPAPPGLRRIAAVAAGGGVALALGDNGRVTAWGDDSEGQTEVPAGLSDAVAISAGGFHCLALRRGGTVAAWGGDEYGQCDVPADLADVEAIAAGGAFSLALRSDGTVAAWGDDRYGQLDVPPDLGDVVAIAAGEFHGLALGADGHVTAWGGGREAGQGRGEGRAPRLDQIEAVAAGDGFSLAIRGPGFSAG